MAKETEYEKITGTNTGTYEEAAASSAIRNSGSVAGVRTPDTPTGAAVHVNPALENGPNRDPAPEPRPVPVINDPGLLGSRIPLAELNRAAREIGVERVVLPRAKADPMPAQDVEEVSEDQQRAEIKKAAQERQKVIVEEANADAKEAVEAGRADAKRSTSKVGSASSKA